ncbi:MAG: hypothetical protein AAFW89_12535 [Bacteroidota bacterium]
MSEFSPSNFRRINLINWFLSVPLMVLFAWPFVYAGRLIGLMDLFVYPGAFLFALPFMITILHGHVTMALGSAHRHLYYDWLMSHPLSFGLFFHTVLVSTRFRLIVLIVSLVFLPVGYVLGL